jgi:hypothetical protein
MKVLKKIFKYIEPLWLGNDGKISLRSSLAIVFSIDLVINLHTVIALFPKTVKLNTVAEVVNALMAGLAQAGVILSIEAAMIGMLLGIKAWQTLKENKLADKQTPIEQPQEHV